MVRSDLLAALRRDHPDLSASDVERIVACLFDSITKCLAENGRVELRGFGSFSTRARAARTGRNPRSGEQVQVNAKRAVHFKPSKEVRARLNDNARSDDERPGAHS